MTTIIALTDNNFGGVGKVSETNPFEKDNQLLDAHGRPTLKKFVGRLMSYENLPEDVELFYLTREYYLTNKITFVAADWSDIYSPDLVLYVSFYHAVYGVYIEDNPPMIQVYKKEADGDVFKYTYMPDIGIVLKRSHGAAKLICNTDTATSSAIDWVPVISGDFGIIVDGIKYDVLGLDFSGVLTMADVATVIDTYFTLNSIPCTCSWETDHFLFMCTSTTVQTDVQWLQKANGTTVTDISGPNYLSGRKGQAEIVEGHFGGWEVILDRGAEAAFDGLIQVA